MKRLTLYGTMRITINKVRTPLEKIKDLGF
jgi:hypothetical protein